MAYLKRITTRRPPQSAPIPGSTQVPNSAGGYTWSVDDWTRLRRFLVLGSEGGTLLRVGADADARERRRGRALHRGGRRPRGLDDRRGQRARRRRRRTTRRCSRWRWRPVSATIETRRAALDALPRVARTGMHLFRFATVRRGLPRLGPVAPSGRRSLVRGAVGRRARLPGGEVPPARGRDAPRPAAAGPPGSRGRRGQPDARRVGRAPRLFEWIVRGGDRDGLPRIVEGFARAQAAETPAATAELVREYGLPREALKSEHLTSPRVWEALLDDMPSTALIRNLATMTRIGLLDAGLGRRRDVAVEQLGDGERLRRARVHPIAVLAALRTYESGRGARGQRRVDAGAGDRRRARRGVLRGVRGRRAGRHPPAARARRVGLDAVGSRGRRPGPEPARRIGGARARDGRDGAELARSSASTRVVAAGRPAVAADSGTAARTASRRSRSARGSG